MARPYYGSLHSHKISDQYNSPNPFKNAVTELGAFYYWPTYCRFIEKINVKQMKNAKLNQKATAPATNFSHSFLF
jgi:hypothetical protein